MKFFNKTSFQIIIIFTTVINAGNEPDTLWTRAFGGTNIDVGYSVQQTTDGGYIAAGYTRSFGTLSGRNMWLLKIDSLGNEQWNNTFGGNADEEAYSVDQTSDGGYILCGYTKSFGAGLNDVILVKADSAGNELWKKTFGGAQDDEGFSVCEINTGGFIIAGVTSSFTAGSRDVWLIKTDASGNEIWKKSFGGLSSDGARSVQQTSDGGFIMTGWTYSYGPGLIGNAWLVKTDSSGNQMWHQFFGGSDADRGYSVKQTTDGGYIYTGYTGSFGAGLYDMLLVKTDSTGNILWNKTFGGTGRDYGNSVVQAPDGGYVIAGYTLSFGAGGDDLWIVKTDASGNEEWSKTLGGTSSDVAYDISMTTNGGYIITGHTLSYGAGVHDLWMIKLGPYVPVELISFTGLESDANIILSWVTATEKNNKGFEVMRQEKGSSELWKTIGFIEGKGTTTGRQEYSFTDEGVKPGVYYYRLRQINFDGSSELSDILEVKSGGPAVLSLMQNYPNPFNPSTNIRFETPGFSHVSIKIYNPAGEEIASLLNENIPAGVHNIVWDASGKSAGVYFVTMRSEKYFAAKKLVLVK